MENKGYIKKFFSDLSDEGYFEHIKRLILTLIVPIAVSVAVGFMLEGSFLDIPVEGGDGEWHSIAEGIATALVALPLWIAFIFIISSEDWEEGIPKKEAEFSRKCVIFSSIIIAIAFLIHIFK
jgi:hypothetical protein